MIRRLRSAHRVIWIVLAILLPLILVLGLLARHGRPVNPDAAIQKAVGKAPR